ncbi:class I SAM-dependent methyltransferase [Asanoa iriomotensis]|uniref:Methyltransferase n=1 Tax=Asanoa iriomotensis TaxID=234613 RepID=A0ABQ4CE05_9ACTN|nr:class I SAM-dependent methyltransferase [Asanoa iriomotensis]GIF61012.1 methyltransferase [Asanoa iriomotensis]
MTAPPAYDAFADWYEEYTGSVSSYMDRVRAHLAALLGPGAGRCLDLCCGGGAHAATIRALGWDPVGVDLSQGQLRWAAARLPVAAGDATRLPVRDASVAAVACVLAHTDVPDYAAVLREAARVLAPGGRLVHVGVHPCFVGAFADRSVADLITINTRYADTAHTFDAWAPQGVRARVGAWHVPMADMLNAVTAAGLRIEEVAESSPNGIPDTFAFRAVRS